MASQTTGAAYGTEVPTTIEAGSTSANTASFSFNDDDSLGEVIELLRKCERAVVEFYNDKA